MTVKLVLAVPPPGAGVVTLIDATVATATSACGTVASSCVGELDVITSAVVFQETVVLALNPVPVMVSVKSD